MKTFLFGKDAPALLFPVGTVLWRSACFTRHDCRLADVEPTKTEKGSSALRVGITGNFMWEPTVHSAKYDGRDTYGLVVFVNEQLPLNWTHLLVTGHSKAMNDPLAKKGQAIFAKAAKPYEGYLAMRKWLAQADLNLPADDALKISLNAWPADFQQGQRRLFAHHYWGDKGLTGYNYCHIRLKTPAEIARDLPEPTEEIA